MQTSTNASTHTRCRVTEIFHSLQGESRTIGCPTTFVRLTGCPLRCHYCDTTYAFQGGQWMTSEEILMAVREHQAQSAAPSDASIPTPFRATQWPNRLVTVTGGEPLAQPTCLGLLVALSDAGFQVSLETSGALDITGVDARVSIVMDLKTPGSGEERKNRYQNIEALSTKDQVKFVLCHRHDYQWAVSQLNKWDILRRCEVLFLPVHGVDATCVGTAPADPLTPISPRVLADWIVEDRLPVRMQIQLHKYLWGDVAGK